MNSHCDLDASNGFNRQNSGFACIYFLLHPLGNVSLYFVRNPFCSFPSLVYLHHVTQDRLPRLVVFSIHYPLLGPGPVTNYKNYSEKVT